MADSNEKPVSKKRVVMLAGDAERRRLIDERPEAILVSENLPLRAVLDPGLRMERRSVQQPSIGHVGLKVGAVLTLIPVIAIGLLLYALYARGVFERTQALTLIAADAEGVVVGMPIMFSGFPIGQVSGMALDELGRVRIEVRIKEKDARWLRVSSEFSVEKQFLGGAKIRAG